MRRATRWAAAAVVALALGTGACATAGGARRAAMDEPATVSVTNSNWLDMTVYVTRDGTRQRLGTVTSMQTRTFRVPKPFTLGNGNVRLLADPIGSEQAYATQPLVFNNGDRLDWKLENNLALSSYRIR